MPWEALSSGSNGPSRVCSSQLCDPQGTSALTSFYRNGMQGGQKEVCSYAHMKECMLILFINTPSFPIRTTVTAQGSCFGGHGVESGVEED